MTSLIPDSLEMPPIVSSGARRLHEDLPPRTQTPASYLAPPVIPSEKMHRAVNLYKQYHLAKAMDENDCRDRIASHEALAIRQLAPRKEFMGHSRWEHLRDTDLTEIANPSAPASTKVICCYVSSIDSTKSFRRHYDRARFDENFKMGLISPGDLSGEFQWHGGSGNENEEICSSLDSQDDWPRKCCDCQSYDLSIKECPGCYHDCCHNCCSGNTELLTREMD